MAIIGRLFNKGVVDLTRTVALTGSEVKQTGYYKMLMGTELKSIFQNNVTEGITLRYISGNPLTGTKIDENGVLRAYPVSYTHLDVYKRQIHRMAITVIGYRIECAVGNP